MSQDEARKSAIAKAGRRLLPFLCLCYAVNFLDRVNVGFAGLSMNDDLGFSPSVFGAGAGIFFVGYILFEVPSNLAMQKFGARIWIARIMISWGIVAIAMAFVSGERSFYAMRFFLGVAEAGFFPGIILYLTYWFPARERARIVSLFMAAVPLATMVGGPVSGALLEMHGLLGLKGWHWLFIVEGLPAVILGVIALKFVDDRPEHARWLSRNERTALASTLAAEAKATRETGYAGFGQALTRPRVLVLGFLYFCIVIGFYGVSFWMPQVIQTYGLTPLEIGFLTAIPFFFAAIAMVLWGAHSDRTGERIWHVALPLLVAGVAFAWSAYPLSEFDGTFKTKDWSKIPSFPWIKLGDEEWKWVDSATFFDVLPQALDAARPLPGEEALYALVRSILDAAATDRSLRKVLKDAAAEADEALVKPLHQFRNFGIPLPHNWTTVINSAEFGTDYLTRTAVAKSYIFINRPRETRYFYQDLDQRGSRLTGANRYTVTFPELPPVDSKGFWSITLYNKNHFFAPNEIDRFSLGTKSKQLRYKGDGSLVIHVQKDKPDTDNVSNWLPAPDDEFSLYIRAYWPLDKLNEGGWTPPPVVPA